MEKVTEKINRTHPLLEELSEKQQGAVLNQNNRLLVLAGAGSGKTKTLIQRIIYLMFESQVKSKNILAITFTKNAANEMTDRLILAADNSGNYRKIIFNKKVSKAQKDNTRQEYLRKYPWIRNITVKTFHSLCYSIMRNHGNPEFDNKFKLLIDKIDEEDIENRHKAKETQSEIIKDIIVKKCEDIEFLLTLKRYILDFYVDKLKTYQNKPGFVDYKKPFTTLKGEKVRSKSERYIADWCYRHNIDYVYEPTINLKDFDFRPDFFIPEINTYIEHVSNLSKGMKNKEEQFKLTNHTLFKTYEHMTLDINKFYEALDRIVFGKIDKKISRMTALRFEEEFSGYHDKLIPYTHYVKSAIDKIKVSNYNITEIMKTASGNPHDRVKVFYELFQPIFEEYTKYCTKMSYLDFNDLLIRSVQLLNNNKEVKTYYQKLFQHVLVDEFQDVNNIQVQLLNELINGGTQLFCVGDDWQSIYGFRGSEVEYIVNFKKYFPGSEIVKLNINYRSNDVIVNASNEVIKKNKFKLDKEIRSLNSSGKKIYLYCSKREEEDGVETVVKKVKQLYEAGYSREDILILYRRSGIYGPYFQRFRELGIKVQAKTIHASKGLEAKIVFIIGLKDGWGGFPNVWEDDLIFQIIKKTNYELLMEEERRLFYVALTRAKDELFLISEQGNESIFVEDIPGEFVDRENFLILNIEKTKTNICKSCNEELKIIFNYCPHCGKEIIEEIDKKVETKTFNTKKLKEIKQEHPMAYELWDEKQEEMLIELFDKKKSVSEISEMMQRKPGGIKARLIKLGLIESNNSELKTVKNKIVNDLTKVEFNEDGSLKLPQNILAMKENEKNSIILRRVQINTNNPAIANLRIEFPEEIKNPNKITSYYNEIKDRKYPSVDHIIKQTDKKTFIIEVNQGTTFMYSLLDHLLECFKSKLEIENNVVVKGTWDKFDSD